MAFGKDEAKFRDRACPNSNVSRTETMNVMKRGSVYQCSSTVTKMKSLGTLDAVRFLDSVCDDDLTPPKELQGKLPPSRLKCSDNSVNLTSKLQYSNCNNEVDISIHSGGYFEFVPSTNGKVNPETLIDDFAKNFKFMKCGPVSSNELEEIGSISLEQKKSSTAMGRLLLPRSRQMFPISPSSQAGNKPNSESEARIQSDIGSKHPIIRMFDPFVKIKSQWNSKACQNPNLNRSTGMADRCSPRVVQKSLLHEFSNARKNVEVFPTAVLHGDFKSKCVQGVPFFEFSTCPDDLMVSRAWKCPSLSNFIYTFHSTPRLEKNNFGEWGLKDIEGEASSMLGQMHASCYLHSEFKEGCVVEYCVASEFVLYDIAHAIKSPNLESQSTSLSSSCTWECSDLQPGFEIAAILMQTPMENVRGIQQKDGGRFCDVFRRNVSYRSDNTMVRVVLPMGNHGLPAGDSPGPSPLLDRWRSGGGCDCGGWDMACPLIVFCNADDHDCTFRTSQRVFELFIQGDKGRTPALALKLMEEGHYGVTFNAQLSTLQAFSICVAIMHGAEVSSVVGKKMPVHLPLDNSLKSLIDSGVKFLTEGVTDDEKPKPQRPWPTILPAFTTNPPSSPIARV